MTKGQKKQFKALQDKGERVAFVEMVAEQQQVLGKYGHWRAAYLKELKKRSIAVFPFLKKP